MSDERTCSECGGNVPWGSRFCPHCGSAQSEASQGGASSDDWAASPSGPEPRAATPYLVGQVVNGYQLGSDHQWHPVGPPPASTSGLSRSGRNLLIVAGAVGGGILLLFILAALGGGGNGGGGGGTSTGLAASNLTLVGCYPSGARVQITNPTSHLVEVYVEVGFYSGSTQIDSSNLILTVPAGETAQGSTAGGAVADTCRILQYNVM